jgi:cell division protease FtsH
LIDEEAKDIVAEQYKRAKKILSENAKGHNELAELLIEREVIFAEDMERVFGKRAWTSRNDELMAQNGGIDFLDDVVEEKPALEALAEEKPEDKKPAKDQKVNF